MTTPFRLTAKRLPIESGGAYVSILNEEDARKLGVSAGDRIKIRYNEREIVTIVDLTDKAVLPGQIGLFEEVSEYLGLKDEEVLEVLPTVSPDSLMYIRKKLDGKRLSKEEIEQIIHDITYGYLSDAEVAMWVVATYTKKFSIDEITHLVDAVAFSGDSLKWDTKPIVDKHCIGGVPNNRTTPIVVPIIASLGYKMPKTSSRSITSPAGTADVVEVFTNVKLTIEEIKEIVEKVGATLAWGGAVNIAPADSKMIKARYPLRLDPLPLLLASILGKKRAVGSTHVLIDIPYGYQAKVSNKIGAWKLSRYFRKVGSRLGMKIKVTLTDGSQPIGNGIGPVLEAIDVFKVLKQEKDRPIDLERKALFLAKNILGLVGHRSKKDAELALRSGRAWEKMKQIIEAQGGDPSIDISDLQSMVGQYTYDIVAERNGVVGRIANKMVSRIAHILGAPKDKGAGMYLYVHVGDRVKKGQKLVTLYAESEYKLDAALKEIEEFGLFIDY